LQRDDGEPEDQGHHGDHRPGDADQQRPRIVGGALEYEWMERRVGSDIDQGQRGAGGERRQHRQGRDDPERTTQVLPDGVPVNGHRGV
jgi:hypothetical protein